MMIMGARNRRLVLCWFNLKVNTINHYYLIVVSSYQLLLRIITKWNSNWLTKSNWHGTKMKFENGGLLNDMTTKLIGLTHVIITWITVSADCFKTVLSIYYPPLLTTYWNMPKFGNLYIVSLKNKQKIEQICTV